MNIQGEQVTKVMTRVLLHDCADILEKVAKYKIWDIHLPEDNTERAGEEERRFIKYNFGKCK